MVKVSQSNICQPENGSFVFCAAKPQKDTEQQTSTQPAASTVRNLWPEASKTSTSIYQPLSGSSNARADELVAHKHISLVHQHRTTAVANNTRFKSSISR